MHENIAKEVYVRDNDQQAQDLQEQMFDYFLSMGSDSGQTCVKLKPQELPQPKMVHSKSQKLDRIEQESCMIQRRLIPGLSLRENNRLKFTDKKEGNTLVLGQSIFEFAEQQTKDGIEMSRALNEHAKVYNRQQNKRYATVDQSRGRIGEMSSQYPPIFQKAKFTKNLYFATNYQKQFTEQKQYQKPGLRLGPMDFRKNKVPLLFCN